MAVSAERLDVYLHLAEASQRHGQAKQTERFLVLAAAYAQGAGFPRIAEDCRERLLDGNPDHFFRQASSVRKAFKSSVFRRHVRRLADIYPFRKAEHLLRGFRVAGYAMDHGYGDILAAAAAAAARDEAESEPAPAPPVQASAWRRRRRRHGPSRSPSLGRR